MAKKKDPVTEPPAEESVALTTTKEGSISLDTASLDIPEATRENIEMLLGMLSGETEGLEVEEDYIYRPTDIYLVQAMTKEERRGDAKNGEIVANSEVVAKLTEELRLFPVMAWVQRTHLNFDTSEVVCSSADAKYSREGDLCERCPDGRWVARTPPSCTQQRAVLFLAEDMSEIYRVYFQKSSAKAGTKVIDSIRRARGIGKCAILLGRSQEQNKRGEKYFQYKVRRDAENPPSPAEVTIVQALNKKFAYDRKKILAMAEARRHEFAAGGPVSPQGVLDVETRGEVDDVSM